MVRVAPFFLTHGEVVRSDNLCLCVCVYSAQREGLLTESDPDEASLTLMYLMYCVYVCMVEIS